MEVLFIFCSHFLYEILHFLVNKLTSTLIFGLIDAPENKKTHLRAKKVKICILRSKTIDKFVDASYNIYIIKQNKLIKSNGKEDAIWEKERRNGRKKKNCSNRNKSKSKFMRV